jgi:hypothetical protein
MTIAKAVKCNSGSGIVLIPVFQSVTFPAIDIAQSASAKLRISPPETYFKWTDVHILKNHF